MISSFSSLPVLMIKIGYRRVRAFQGLLFLKMEHSK